MAAGNPSSPARYFPPNDHSVHIAPRTAERNSKLNKESNSLPYPRIHSCGCRGLEGFHLAPCLLGHHACGSLTLAAAECCCFSHLKRKSKPSYTVASSRSNHCYSSLALTKPRTRSLHYFRCNHGHQIKRRALSTTWPELVGRHVEPLALAAG